MTAAGAEKAVTVSALVVGGLYTYRLFTEGAGPAAPAGGKLPQLVGQGSPPPVGAFITAYGTAFLIISMIAAANPSLGGAFALLVATADALGNGAQVAADINRKTGQAAARGATQTAQTVAPRAAHDVAAGVFTAINGARPAH